ncbi:hypothetical protein [Ekhidna sp.]
MSDIVTIVIAIISSGGFGGLIAWLTNRKINKAQEGKTKAETQEIYGKLYSQMIKDLADQKEQWKKRYEEAAKDFEDEVSKLNIHISQIETLTKKLKKQVEELTKENRELKKQIKG